MTDVMLTPAQDRWLVFLENSGESGAARKLPELVALEAKGFARFGGTRALPRVERWHITQEGRDWLEARRAADREAEL